jgi:hypothetical protein
MDSHDARRLVHDLGVEEHAAKLAANAPPLSTVRLDALRRILGATWKSFPRGAGP